MSMMLPILSRWSTSARSVFSTNCTAPSGTPALVAASDVGRLALLRPGDTVRVALLSLEEASLRAAERRAGLPAKP